jgi:two-component system, cell cycle sensor histidine kinase PleC
VVQNDQTLHALKRFELAADYIRTNGFTTPVFSHFIALILWNWFPAWQVFGWAVIASVMQLAMGLTAHAALRDTDIAQRLWVWRIRLSLISVLAAVLFSSAVVAFYIPGERLNNLLLIGMSVASIATMAAMTSPDPQLKWFGTFPHATALVLVVLVHEAYPISLLFALLAVMYCAESFFTSSKLSSMVGRMIDLQLRNDALIESLAQEKQESDAARIKAENASRAKSTFLANMSHELRTPLNAILGFSEIIRDRVLGDKAIAKYSDYAGDVHKSGAHLLNLINDILDLSRIEAGKFELMETKVDIAALFANVMVLNATQAANRGVTLNEQRSPGAQILADEKAAAQILINLVANAIKFTPAGGSVTLLQSFNSGGGVVLQVRDTGVGIKPADMPRILERFGQAQHDIASNGDKGVGLGLPIAKGLASAHGATLSVQSEPGRGTTVSVEFPPHRTLQAAAAA